ncbi:MAG: type 4a pilus biogenesis protein PilO [Desulfobacter sp.]|nr:type 4a pilus biogenesis protein PilO [Desulfobacter sp.]WDP85073.1 MAG: type 4a pilus biogenesis protein PilO [Desulfobacter sp.]
MAEENKEKIGNPIQARLESFFVRIGKLTKIQRVVVCCVSLLLIGGAYYYFIFAPRYELLKAAKEELQVQQDKLESYKIKARSLAKYEKKMAEAQERFNIAMKALPDKKELPSLLTGVSKAGRKAGLDVLLFQPEPIVNKEFYLEIPVSMTVRGRYHQVADFFFQVAGLNRIVNIQDMSMTTDPKTKEQVQMKCSAVTYMFADPGEAASKDKKGKKNKKRG